MSKLVEKMAEAFFAAWPRDDTSWAKVSDRIKDEYRAAARAALAVVMAEIDVVLGAYPEEVFGKPDLHRAHELLQAGGMTVDAVSASGARLGLRVLRRHIGEQAGG